MKVKVVFVKSFIWVKVLLLENRTIVTIILHIT
jgi:hypothetical protein